MMVLIIGVIFGIILNIISCYGSDDMFKITWIFIFTFNAIFTAYCFIMYNKELYYNYMIVIIVALIVSRIKLFIMNTF